MHYFTPKTLKFYPFFWAITKCRHPKWSETECHAVDIVSTHFETELDWDILTIDGIQESLK